MDKMYEVEVSYDLQQYLDDDPKFKTDIFLEDTWKVAVGVWKIAAPVVEAGICVGLAANRSRARSLTN